MSTRWLKTLIPVTIVLIGTAQVWDSGALSAAVGLPVTLLALTAVVIPAGAAVLTARRIVHVWSVLACGALLVLARLLSPVALNELLLAAFFPAMLLLVLPAQLERAAR